MRLPVGPNLTTNLHGETLSWSPMTHKGMTVTCVARTLLRQGRERGMLGGEGNIGLGAPPFLRCCSYRGLMVVRVKIGYNDSFGLHKRDLVLKILDTVTVGFY